MRRKGNCRGSKKRIQERGIVGHGNGGFVDNIDRDEWGLFR